MRMLMPYWRKGTLASDLFEEMDRVFDGFGGAPRVYDERSYQPPFEMSETDDRFSVSVDLPGIKREDIKVELAADLLTISADRKRGEKSYGFFRRSFTLPTSIDADKVEARYQDGVLELTLPKAESAKPRRIEIQSGKNGIFSKLLGTKKDENQQLKEVGPEKAS